MGEVIPFPVPQSAEPPARTSRAEPRPVSKPEPRRAPAGPESLWRTVVGEQLRAARADRGERIADVADRVGMSPQYLSEIERGRKDPSSEMLAAVVGALGLTTRELVRRIALRYDAATALTFQPTIQPTSGPTQPLCLAA